MNARTEESVANPVFALDIRASLNKSPRQLPSRYLYDELGSALFEAICALPWYRVTRAETALFERHGRQILEACKGVRSVVELGPGSGAKLACLLSARGRDAEPLEVHLIDVSAAALSAAATLLGALPGIQVHCHEAAYDVGLDALNASADEKLVLMLGSNIGNFDRADALELLRETYAGMRPGDHLLLGADLVKPENELLLAYDDPLGVTAAFNRNLLLRINRELGGDFDLDGFDYRVTWNAQAARIEAWLVSRWAQRVSIPASDLVLDLAENEPIWVESSHKHTQKSMFALLSEAGFTEECCWENREDGFALVLVRR